MSNNSTPRIDILIRSWPKLIAYASKSKYDFQLKLVFLKHFNKHLISSTPVSTPCYSWVFIFKCIQTFKVEHKLIRCNSIVSLLTSIGYKWLPWLNELDQYNLIYQKKVGGTQSVQKISCQKFPHRRRRPPLNIIENNFIKSLIAQVPPTQWTKRI